MINGAIIYSISFNKMPFDLKGLTELVLNVFYLIENLNSKQLFLNDKYF